MAMNRTNVEEIKARIPIEELVASYIKVEKSGHSFKAKCPFHNEKTASFFISPERGGYYCFGCGAKGDIFSFVEQFEGLDFKGALKVLAEKAGVPLIVDQKVDSDKDKLFKITEEACKFFEDQLEKSKEARDYIKSRGINPETCKSFKIGWAPEGWHNLLNYLKKNGWAESVIEKAGLIKAKENVVTAAVGEDISPTSAIRQPAESGTKGKLAQPKGSVRYYDRFRGRIIFPITDSSGRVVAFTGRILKDDGKSAKYLNSPETPLFNKSQILFGLDKAKSEIRRIGYSILVEGQMDLVLSHQVGVKNVIAASGTALTDQAQGESGVVSNLGMVRRLSSNMIIALDADKAGRAATMRAVAATALSMGMSVKIADPSTDGQVGLPAGQVGLPAGQAGKDPADLILTNPESWKEVLKKSKHVIEYELGNVLQEVTDPHKLGKAVRERVFPFLAKIDSEMDKAYFLKIISEQAHLNEQAVWEDLRKFEKTAKQSVTVNDHSGGKTRTLESSTHSKSDDSKMGQPLRIDLVERRMFGLLNLMENFKSADVKKYRDEIKKISGDSYKVRIDRIEPIISDLSFEAESFYGDDKDRWNVHMKELIFNFEEDIINEELIETMGKLRVAEKGGDNKLVAEMVQKCQALSLRKAEVGKQRRG